jgi:hypothetical protein
MMFKVSCTYEMLTYVAFWAEPQLASKPQAAPHTNNDQTHKKTAKDFIKLCTRTVFKQSGGHTTHRKLTNHELSFGSFLLTHMYL